MKKKMIKLTKETFVDVEMLDGSIKQYPREETRFIKTDGKYYLPGITCFRIKHPDGTLKWHRWNNGKIGFNVDNESWELVKTLEEDSSLIKGIYNENGHFGYFKINPFKNVYLVETPNEQISSAVLCINEDVASKLGYVESVSHGVWINKNSMTTSNLIKLSQKSVFKYGKTTINYNADEGNPTFLSTIQEFKNNSHLIQITGKTASAAKLLDNYTFGFEIETCNGTIPKNLIGPLGLVPLKDGSLRDANGIEPYEYTTIPLTGEKGLEVLRLISQELEKRCEFNEKCSVHIHISGIKNITEEFCIALYKAVYNIQNEIYSLFPHYKTVPQNYIRNFQKNYCQPLTNLGIGKKDRYLNVNKTQFKKSVKQDFDTLYYFLSDQTVDTTNDKYNLNSFIHPKGQTQKWNLHSRYYHMNLIPFVFSRKRTVEWRLHTPTLNFIKLSSWLFICSAIMKFVEANQNAILTDTIKYDLNTILQGYINNFGLSSYRDEYGEFASKFLIDYCNMRKQAMKESIEKGDGFGYNIEFKGEKKFNFTSQGENSLY